MDSSGTTHINIVVLGTGLVESILAAALAKSGYSVLQLDKSPYYGDDYASLSVLELVEWASRNPTLSTHTPPSAALDALSSRFALSLKPTLLLATGKGIDVLVRSKVAAYLSFGLLDGVALCTKSQTAKDIITERVPASKSDVFNHPDLSLVQKRRLTKLLLFLASEESIEDTAFCKDSATRSSSLLHYLKTSFALDVATVQSLAFALGLCTSADDLALPALQRMRRFIRSTGRYGASPFLVGQYGGAGDLIGAFSRICAVWGGGQILGRSILPLHFIDYQEPAEPILSPAPSSAVTVSRITATSLSTPQSTRTTSTSQRLALAVALDPAPAKPEVFTADWIIASQSHLDLIHPPSFPIPTSVEALEKVVHSVSAIVILTSAVSFPPTISSAKATPTSEEEATIEAAERKAETPDSNVFIFPAGQFEDLLGTVTVLQVGAQTFACPEGYHVLYFTGPILTPSTESTIPSAETLLTPYVDALVTQSTTPPSFTLFHSTAHISPPPSLHSELSNNILIVPTLPSTGTTATFVNMIDEAVELAEELFWEIVNQSSATGTAEDGIEFFVRDTTSSEDED